MHSSRRAALRGRKARRPPVSSRRSRLVWLGNNEKLFSVGFTKLSEREYSVWDPKNMAEPLAKARWVGNVYHGLPLELYPRRAGGKGEYLAFLDDTNLSEAQKIELLQTLWSIMSAFVDLAFGTDPVQQTLPSLAADQHDGPTGSVATLAERE